MFRWLWRKSFWQSVQRGYDEREIAACLKASPCGSTGGGYSSLYLINNGGKLLSEKRFNEVKDINTNKGYELVNFCEFDKYAVTSYCAIHGYLQK